MTHSGGQPHNVGDKGQRYAVTYYDDDGVVKGFGWSATIEGAEAMCQSVDLHPSMTRPMIYDRERKAQVDRPGAIDRSCYDVLGDPNASDAEKDAAEAAADYYSRN